MVSATVTELPICMRIMAAWVESRLRGKADKGGRLRCCSVPTGAKLSGRERNIRDAGGLMLLT